MFLCFLCLCFYFLSFFVCVQPALVVLLCLYCVFCVRLTHLIKIACLLAWWALIPHWDWANSTLYTHARTYRTFSYCWQREDKLLCPDPLEIYPKIWWSFSGTTPTKNVMMFITFKEFIIVCPLQCIAALDSWTEYKVTWRVRYLVSGVRCPNFKWP